MRNIITSMIGLLVFTGLAGAIEKDLGKPHPIEAKHWDSPFRPGTSTIVGSYTTVIRLGPEKFVAFNNTMAPGPEDGLLMWEGKSPTKFKLVGVVLEHQKINDLLDKKGAAHPKRRFTRPFMDWHPEKGFVGIIHVCRGYPPPDARVYPALISSPTGKPGDWTYHGRLKGEIWDEFGDKGKARWGNGGGFFYQPDAPEKPDGKNPLNNQYVFFSDQYAGPGSLAILYSSDGKRWQFYRRDGDPGAPIVNLIKVVAGKPMIFPCVTRMGQQGWTLFLSEKWPPIAIWRLWSPDGLSWKLFGDQPEIVKPKDLMIKNVTAWYDPLKATLHGYLSVWSKQPDGTHNYDKYHATTRQLVPDSRKSQSAP